MATLEHNLAALKSADRETRLLQHVTAIVEWDQETYMPSAAIEERAEQMALLSSLVHERETSERTGELLELCGANEANPAGDASLGEIDRAFLREKYRQYSRATKLPGDLVREKAQVTAKAQSVWIEARKADDFSLFFPHLKKIVELSRASADLLGYESERYDALLEEFEPGMRSSQIDQLFGDLQVGLVALLSDIGEVKQIDDSFARAPYEIGKQETLSRKIMAALGYEESRGRLDVSAHPMTTTLGRDDVRITTRYLENRFISSVCSTIHESGHALYELGFSQDLSGTILAEATSLGFHESQSRFWENMIGRSWEFWRHWLEPTRELFPAQLAGVDTDRFVRAINKVEPSLIRVEADEVTYSLHVILRYRIEQRLIAGDLEVVEAPEAWNDLSRTLLGIEPTSFATGILQDIHWSGGAFGYFPTYALGNLFAGHLLDQIQHDVPSMWQEVARGEYGTILTWMRERVHRHGSVYPAPELIRRITGSELSAAPFLEYLSKKYARVYNLEG